MRGLTLFGGMYAITVTMFYIQSGSILTGLTFGAVSAGLKTVWAKVHPMLYKEPIEEMPHSIVPRELDERQAA